MSLQHACYHVMFCGVEICLQQLVAATVAAVASYVCLCYVMAACRFCSIDLSLNVVSISFYPIRCVCVGGLDVLGGLGVVACNPTQL